MQVIQQCHSQTIFIYTSGKTTIISHERIIQNYKDVCVEHDICLYMFKTCHLFHTWTKHQNIHPSNETTTLPVVSKGLFQNLVSCFAFYCLWMHPNQPRCIGKMCLYLHFGPKNLPIHTFPFSFQMKWTLKHNKTPTNFIPIHTNYDYRCRLLINKDFISARFISHYCVMIC